MAINGGETYRIAVSALNATSGFFDLEVDFNPDESGLPDEINAWQNVTHLVPLPDGTRFLEDLSIDNPSEFDFYLINANDDDQSSTGTVHYTFETEGNLDTQLGVYVDYDEFSNSDFLIGDDDSGINKNASVTVELQDSLRYVILVRSDNSETGSYQLRMSRPTESIEEVRITGLESKGAADIDIDTRNLRYQSYQVTAPSNATEVDILAFQDGTDIGDFSMRVSNANGQILAFVDEGGEGESESLNQFPVTPGETLYVTLNNLNDERNGARPELRFDFSPDFEPDPGVEFVVNSTTEGDQIHSNVASNPEGLSVVTWSGRRSSSDTQDDIFFQILDSDGSQIGTEQRIQGTSDTLDQEAPKVAIEDSGRFVIGWTTEGGQLQYQRFDSEGIPLGSITNTGIVSRGFRHTGIAVLNSGRVMAVAVDHTRPGLGSNDELVGRIFNVNDTPRTPVFTIDGTTDEKRSPSIDTTLDGGFVVGWSAESDARNQNYNTEPVVSFFAVYDSNGNQLDVADRNFTFGDLGGIWYQDTNQNGGLDPGEPLLANQEIFADSNGNSIRDAGESMTTTDSEGAYLFTNLSSGFYKVLALDGSNGGASTLTDDFNRPDSTDLGPDWLELEGDSRIESGKLRTFDNPAGNRDRSTVIYQPLDAGLPGIQTFHFDFEIDATRSDGNGYLELMLGYADPDTFISVAVASPSSVTGFNSLTFRDTRNGYGDNWARMLGGVEYETIAPFESARGVASLDPHSKSVTIGFDTNFDGDYDVLEVRSGVEFAGLGRQIGFKGIGNIGIDNVRFEATVQNVIPESAVQGFEMAWHEEPEGLTYQDDTRISVAPDGTLVATYIDRDFALNQEIVVAAQYDANYQKLVGGVRVNTLETNDGFGGTYPDIAALNDQRFVVVWQNVDEALPVGSNNIGIAGQKFGPNGQKIGPEFQINQHLPGRQKRVAIGSDGIDSFFATWESGGGGNDYLDGNGTGIIGRSLLFEESLESELEVVDSVGNPFDRYLDFGSIPVGSGNRTVSFEIRNDGVANLNISNLELVGDDVSVFSLTGGPGAFELLPGEQQTFFVELSTAAEGDFFASVRFEHDDTSDLNGGDFDPSPQWISLHATVVGAPRLTVETIPTEIREDAGTGAGSLVITRENADTTNPLVISLASSDTTEAQLPATATIPAGESTVVVPVDAVDDNIDDGAQVVNLFALANGFQQGFGQLTVQSVNHAPTLDPVPDQSVNLGQTFSYQVNAVDPDQPADQLTFELTESPSSAAIDASTGQITWTPDAIGAYSFTISVMDDGEPVLSDAVTFQVNVTNNEKVIPVDSIQVVRGNQVAGGVSELAVSDNMDLSLRRSQQAVASIIEFKATGVSPIMNPSQLQFTIESSVFARGAVMQTLLLFNFQSGEYEEIDSRTASRFKDATTIVDLQGDLSRFVAPSTGELQVLVRYRGATPRLQFAANIDLIHWTIQ